MMWPGPAGRLSRALVGCHPRRWRERYGEEMLDVLDQHHPTARPPELTGSHHIHYNLVSGNEEWGVHAREVR